MLRKDFFLIALNKPKGVICTHKDEKNRTRIYDLLPKSLIKHFEGNIHSVGRLDFNSQGLILLTNNKKVKNYFEKPESKIIRIYKAKVQGHLTNNHLNQIKEGIFVKKIKYKVVSIVLIKQTKTYSWVKIILNEGKNKHIRKIFKKFGFTVTKLIRLQYGPYKLSTLNTGQIKWLNLNKSNFT